MVHERGRGRRSKTDLQVDTVYNRIEVLDHNCLLPRASGFEGSGTVLNTEEVRTIILQGSSRVAEVDHVICGKITSRL